MEVQEVVATNRFGLQRGQLDQEDQSRDLWKA